MGGTANAESRILNSLFDIRHYQSMFPLRGRHGIRPGGEVIGPHSGPYVGTAALRLTVAPGLDRGTRALSARRRT